MEGSSRQMAGAPGHSPNMDYFSLCVVWLSLDPSPSSFKARMSNQVKFFRIKEGKIITEQDPASELHCASCGLAVNSGKPCISETQSLL